MTLQPPSLKSIPQHVALIMDGNGRWAEANGKSRIEGHREGAQSVRAVLRAAATLGINVVTVYAFSTENWKRPPQEIEGLMKLFIESLNTYEEELHDSQIRLRIMGQIERLPAPFANASKRLCVKPSTTKRIHSSLHSAMVPAQK